MSTEIRRIRSELNRLHKNRPTGGAALDAHLKQVCELEKQLHRLRLRADDARAAAEYARRVVAAERLGR